MYPIPTEMMLVSVLVLLAGVLFTRWGLPGGHIVRGAGWLAFGIYWLPWGPYFLGMHDYVNALATFGALPVMAFLAYHEYLCHRWDEEYEPLRFASLAVCIAGIGFYIVYSIEPVSILLIRTVGTQTVWSLNGISPGYHLGPAEISPEGEYALPVLLDRPHFGGEVYIVIACTAIQAILVAAAFILTVNAPIKRRVFTFTIVAVSTYLLNLLRNVLIIYLVYEGITDFETAHAIVGKIAISLLGFFTLMMLAFTLLPELYLTINGLFDLPWRRAPAHNYKAHVGRLIDALFPGKS